MHEELGTNRAQDAVHMWRNTKATDVHIGLTPSKNQTDTDMHTAIRLPRLRTYSPGMRSAVSPISACTSGTRVGGTKYWRFTRCVPTRARPTQSYISTALSACAASPSINCVQGGSQGTVLNVSSAGTHDGVCRSNYVRIQPVQTQSTAVAP